MNNSKLRNQSREPQHKPLNFETGTLEVNKAKKHLEFIIGTSRNERREQSTSQRISSKSNQTRLKDDSIILPTCETSKYPFNSTGSLGSHPEGESLFAESVLKWEPIVSSYAAIL